jgi:sodium transport system permease protein
MAILVSSLFFGVAHTVLQQSLTAFALGMVIGYLAVQTGSLLPGILLHAVHNTLQLSVGLVADGPLVDHPALKQIVRIVEPGYVVYHWSLVLLSGLVAAGLLFWFHRLPFQASPEEQLHRALDQRRRPAGMAV